MHGAPTDQFKPGQRFHAHDLRFPCFEKVEPSLKEITCNDGDELGDFEGLVGGPTACDGVCVKGTRVECKYSLEKL